MTVKGELFDDMHRSRRDDMWDKEILHGFGLCDGFLQQLTLGRKYRDDEWIVLHGMSRGELCWADMHVGERKFDLYGMKLLPQVFQVLLLCGATSTEKAHFNLSAMNLEKCLDMSYYQLEGSSFIVPWSKINQKFLNALPSWRCNGFSLDDSKKQTVILQRLVCSTRQHHPATTLLCWMHHSFRRVVQNGIVYVAKFVGVKMVTARKLLLTSVKCYQSKIVQAHIESRNQTELSITIQQ
jgi:hypothetical protein